MRLALKALGDNIVVEFCVCWAVIPGPFPYTNLKRRLCIQHLKQQALLFLELERLGLCKAKRIRGYGLGRVMVELMISVFNLYLRCRKKRRCFVCLLRQRSLYEHGIQGLLQRQSMRGQQQHLFRAKKERKKTWILLC
jgi:hypothetical protein